MAAAPIIRTLTTLLSLTTTAPSSACTKSPCQDLLCLSAYTPAEAYCSAHYPIPAVTVTITTQLEALPKRHWEQRNHRHKTTTTPTRGRGHSSKRSERWKDCPAKEHSFLSTLCHCIETTSTDTVTVVVPPPAPIVLPPTETIVLPPSETGIVPPPTDPENGTLPP